jgi:hypothetical protein
MLNYLPILFLFIFLSTNTAFASPLDVAVDDYNNAASALPSLWESFQSAQSAAFDDYNDWLTNLYYYHASLSLDNSGQTDLFWEASQSVLEILRLIPVNQQKELSVYSFLLCMTQHQNWIKFAPRT